MRLKKWKVPPGTEVPPNGFSVLSREQLGAKGPSGPVDLPHRDGRTPRRRRSEHRGPRRRARRGLRQLRPLSGRRGAMLAPRESHPRCDERAHFSPRGRDQRDQLSLSGQRRDRRVHRAPQPRHEQRLARRVPLRTGNSLRVPTGRQDRARRIPGRRPCAG